MVGLYSNIRTVEPTLSRISSLQAFQVRADVAVALRMRQTDQLARGTLAQAPPTDAAVTHSSTGRALPVRVFQALASVLSVAVLQTGTAELSANADTRLRATNRLHIQRLLSALVTRGTIGSVVLFVRESLRDHLQFFFRNLVWSPRSRRGCGPSSMLRRHIILVRPLERELYPQCPFLAVCGVHRLGARGVGRNGHPAPSGPGDGGLTGVGGDAGRPGRVTPHSTPIANSLLVNALRTCYA